MSLDIFAQFATDESLENNGTWFPLAEGTRVLVARSDNRAYAKLLTKLVEQGRKSLDLGGEVADKKSDEIMVEVMAKTILLGWEGVSFKGVDLEYSVETAMQVLSIRDFRKRIAQFADDTTAFKMKVEEEQGKA